MNSHTSKVPAEEPAPSALVRLMNDPEVQNFVRAMTSCLEEEINVQECAMNAKRAFLPALEDILEKIDISLSLPFFFHYLIYNKKI